MKILYRAVATQDYYNRGWIVQRNGSLMSNDCNTKDEVLEEMKVRPGYTVGTPFRVEEVYIIERDDVKDLEGDK